jgi:hypothetical protein
MYSSESLSWYNHTKTVKMFTVKNNTQNWTFESSKKFSKAQPKFLHHSIARDTNKLSKAFQSS